MRHLSALTLFGLTAICCSAHAQLAPNSIVCDSKPQPGDRLDVSCPLPASAEAKRFRFTANFAGGHDDTMAQLVAGLDDQHLTCEPGSKVSLMAEDGEVSLFCIFTAPPSQKPQVFQLALSWTHAQYLNFTVNPE